MLEVRLYLKSELVDRKLYKNYRSVQYHFVNEVPLHNESLIVSRILSLGRTSANQPEQTGLNSEKTTINNDNNSDCHSVGIPSYHERQHE